VPNRSPLAAVLVLLAAAGACPAADWRDRLAADLPLFGHRNWIVIADSAYPAQSRPGVEVVATEADHLEVVRAVFEAIDRSRHVRPVVFTDAELKFVPEADARGVTAYRRDLGKLLAKRAPTDVPHEELLSRLDKAGASYRVLVLKTNLAVPYTSVFIQLDCGYWSPEAEKRLREAMKAGQ